MSDVYTRIKEIIKENNMTGIDLGKLLGLKKSPLTDWKNGQSSPTLEQILRICEFFAISSDYLLFGKTIDYSHKLSPDETELIETYNKLDRRGQHRVHAVIYEEIDRIKEEKSTSSKGKAIG